MFDVARGKAGQRAGLRPTLRDPQGRVILGDILVDIGGVPVTQRARRAPLSPRVPRACQSLSPAALRHLTERLCDCAGCLTGQIETSADLFGVLDSCEVGDTMEVVACGAFMRRSTGP